MSDERRTLCKSVKLTREELEDLKNGFAVLKTTKETGADWDLMFYVED